MGGGATPSLSDADTLTVPDVVFLPATLAMERGYHARLSVFLTTLFGLDHLIALEMKEVNVEIMERDTEL